MSQFAPCTSKCQTAEIVREVVNHSISKPAKFYVSFGNVLDGHLGFDRLAPFKFFPPPRDPDWIPATSPYFKAVEMPPSAGGHWKHFRLDVDPDALSPFLLPLRLQSDCALPLTDVFGWPPFSFVSRAAQEKLAGIAPDSSYFVPAELYRSTGEKIEGNWFHWIIRDRLFHDTSGDWAKSAPKVMLPFPGLFAAPLTAGELTALAGLRDYLDKVPIWGLGMNFIQFAMNATVFSALKATGLTGLVENTASLPGDRKLHENIGHIP